jgi:hypothetical protein
MTAALAALGGRGFFARLQLAEAGWVDAVEAVRGYDYVVRAAIPGDPLAEALLPRLWTLAALEIWMRGGLRVEGEQAAGGGAVTTP